MLQQIDLETVRTAIAKAGANWIAEETIISRMKAREQRALLLPKPPVRREVPVNKLPFRPSPLPSCFDWRDVNGHNYVTPVKNQVGPTCIAYANTAALESLILRTAPSQYNEIDLSEHALVSCNDGYPSIIAEFLISTGLPPEACYPSDAATWDSSAPCTGWQDQTYKVVSHNYYRHLTPDDVKVLIVNYGPVVTGMNVPSDFFNYRTGVYSSTMRPEPGSFHEVLIIGYDDQAQCFICKNSWGTGWGEGGFFRIAYREFDTDVDFGESIDTFSGIVWPRVNSCRQSAQAKQLVVGQNADGRLEVFYIGTNDALYHNWQTVPNGAWNGEVGLGGWAKQLVVGQNADGRLEVFYIGTNDALYHNWQTVPNGAWNGEVGLGGWAKQLVVEQNADGRLEVFYIGTNDALYHNWQTVPNGAWNGEVGLGGWAKQLVVGQNADGRLEVFYIGTNDALYHNWQTVPNGAWNGEVGLGGWAKQLVVGQNADGRLEVFYIGTNDALYHNWQTVPNGAWNGEHEMT